jgi:hypothetical protein
LNSIFQELQDLNEAVLAIHMIAVTSSGFLDQFSVPDQPSSHQSTIPKRRDFPMKPGRLQIGAIQTSHAATLKQARELKAKTKSATEPTLTQTGRNTKYC